MPEDTLLDMQLRRFFQDEFGDAEPPATAFSRLLRAIRQAHKGATGLPPVAAPLMKLAQRLYERWAGSNRLQAVNKLLALSLVLAALSTAGSQMLPQRIAGWDDLSTPTVSARSSMAGEPAAGLEHHPYNTPVTAVGQAEYAGPESLGSIPSRSTGRAIHNYGDEGRQPEPAEYARQGKGF